MSRRPVQDIRIFGVQARQGRSKPYILRRRVDGREHADGFSTKAEADRYRARLIVARQDGERFDRRTGEPESWAPRGADMQAHKWARTWVAEHWPEWQPRTRTNEIDGLVRFVPLLVAAGASDPPADLRAYLRKTLEPEADIDQDHEAERWLTRWVLTLEELGRKNLAAADLGLGVGDMGQPLQGETPGRYRRTARACVRRAVELEYIPVDPWPPSAPGRSRRKVNRVEPSVDIKLLHGPATVVVVLDCLVNHKPESRMYQAMTAVVYYAALRPSEVVRLRPELLYLPETVHDGECGCEGTEVLPVDAEGQVVDQPDAVAFRPCPGTAAWGSIAVDEADNGRDQAAAPKNWRRRVPIPPRLVRLLRNWIAEHDIERGQLLFRTRHGNRPSESNWCRALQLAHHKAGVHHIAVYDYRHAAATAWIRNRMPLAEAARRLGDSVKTLVEYYIDAMEGDAATGNACVESALDGTRDEIFKPDEETL